LRPGTKPRPNRSPAGRKSGKISPPVEPPQPLSPGRKRLFRFVSAVLLPLFLLGGLEGALRLAGYGYATGFFEKKWNLQDIIQVGLNSGAKILLDTVAVNLKDCAPFASLTNSILPAAERTEFDTLFAEARADQAQSNFDGAAQKFALAAHLDP
jgi:hypothetical protein